MLGERDLSYATYLSVTVMLMAFVAGYFITQTTFFAAFGWIIMFISGDCILSMIYAFVRDSKPSERTLFEHVLLTAGLGGALLMWLLMVLFDEIELRPEDPQILIACMLWAVASGYTIWIVQRQIDLRR